MSVNWKPATTTKKRRKLSIFKIRFILIWQITENMSRKYLQNAHKHSYVYVVPTNSNLKRITIYTHILQNWTYTKYVLCCTCTYYISYSYFVLFSPFFFWKREKLTKNFMKNRQNNVCMEKYKVLLHTWSSFEMSFVT